ncbi:secreted protein [Indibacter alkaliphilus LW1]|uniref:Secreted protein n=1 Tax=Indibacter alkaliphilus (strain CCUG 57479 / KCTC 22604 / LW1) TaxID=1189612 RepID=S2DIA4_INDAL|nr:DUF2268 domain-containing putative Zn-dependent protease [Indibacter alkaliphilus]EOZ98749.1 secreted protein [Indibacter alkaliphilus LW1]
MKMKLVFGLIIVFVQCWMPLKTSAQEGTVHEWLSKSRSSISQGDTLNAIVELENAVHLGLFDIHAISQSSVLNFLIKDPRGRQLINGITSNRKHLSDPKNLIVDTSDIHRFWQFFDSLHQENASELFFENYIENGSLGLKTFYRVRMGQQTDKFVSRIRTLESYYRSIKNVSFGFDELKPEIVAAAEKLKDLYPESIFPPIYFLLGSLNNMGTPDGFAGMLIGTEHLCKSPETDLTSLSKFDKMVIFDVGQTVPIIVHEYVHLQQKNTTERTLLDYAIMEGAADFVAYLILGNYTNPDLYEFGFSHEDQLWEIFKSQMHTEDTDDWLFNAYNPDTGFPANLGYFIGFRICESYYLQALDKRQAIKEMLEIHDFEEFYMRSAYK